VTGPGPEDFPGFPDPPSPIGTPHRDALAERKKKREAAEAAKTRRLRLRVGIGLLALPLLAALVLRVTTFHSPDEPPARLHIAVSPTPSFDADLATEQLLRLERAGLTDQADALARSQPCALVNGGRSDVDTRNAKDVRTERRARARFEFELAHHGLIVGEAEATTGHVTTHFITAWSC
jgi:hypothetical protein